MPALTPGRMPELDAGADAGADAGGGGAGIVPVVPSIGAHSAAAADPAGALAAGALLSVIAPSRRTIAPLPSLAPIAGVAT